MLSSLEQAGYKNYWKVLNAKDFGVPQHRERERVFIVSIRKDLDKGYEFPKSMPLEKRLIDVLEQEVDENYYLNQKQIERLKSTSFNGRNHMPFIPVKENTKKGYTIANVGDSVNISYPNSKTRRGRVGKGVSQTLTASGDNMSVVVYGETVRVRKLTPLEYWRLMGFTDEEFSKAKLVCSDSQLYKQAGNSIVVNVLVELYKKIIGKN